MRLPSEQIKMIVTAEQKHQLIIQVDVRKNQLLFITGDLKKYTTPLFIFDITSEQMNNCEIIDFGHAVRFGDLEISATNLIRESND